MTYTYDALDRRIARTVDADGAGPQAAESTRFVYDGQHVWADFDAAGTVQARYLFGQGLDDLLARYRPAEGAAWYLTDHLGTVRDLVEAAGQLLNHLDYDSFGQVLGQTNPAAGDRYGFTGREYDPATGLYYYRARFYDPQSGRFLSQDPIGFAAGDANLYRYVGNDPLGATDPSGLMAAIGYSKTDRSIAGALLMQPQTCFLMNLGGGMVVRTVFKASELAAGIHGNTDLRLEAANLALDVATAAIACAILPPASLALSTFGATAVSLEAALISCVPSLAVSASSAVLREVGLTHILFAKASRGGGEEGRSGAGKSDPHGRPAGEKLRKQLEKAEQDLQELIRNQGPKSEKTRLENLIVKLRRKIEQMRKGETHWRRGK